MKFNMNNYVMVKMTDKGIEYYVNKYNEDQLPRLQISFEQFKSEADENGYHKFQMWKLIHYFGDQYNTLGDLINVNILIADSDIIN